MKGLQFYSKQTKQGFAHPQDFSDFRYAGEQALLLSCLYLQGNTIMCSHVLCLNRRAAQPHSVAIHLRLTKPRFQNPRVMNLYIRNPLDSKSTAENTNYLGSILSLISKTQKFFLCKLPQKNMVT